MIQIKLNCKGDLVELFWNNMVSFVASVRDGSAKLRWQNLGKNVMQYGTPLDQILDPQKRKFVLQIRLLTET